jgi:hypothetical protein
MPERLWYSYVIPASVEHVAEAIRQGEALPGLAHHVRPLIRDAVFHTFEKDGEFSRHDGSQAATAPVGATDADAEDGAWGLTPGGRKPGTVVAPVSAEDMHRED